MTNLGYASTSRDRKKHLCPTSGKIRYRDGHDAMLALERLRRARAKAEIAGATHRIRMQRRYWCSSCDGWHLTSRPGDKSGPAAGSTLVDPVAA